MKLKIMKSMMAAVVGVSLAALPVQKTVASSPDATNIVSRLSEVVRNRWGQLGALSGRAVTLRSEMDGLPDKALFTSDKASHSRLIHNKVLLIRELLLSTTAQDLMKQVDALDRKIADIDHDIHKESARDVFCPSQGGRKDPCLKLREKRRRLVCEREEAVRVVLSELETLGLRLSGGTEQILFLADARDLIDAVIVAKSIGIVVENLRTLMATGDVAAAKRYFGMYLVLIDVQKTCFDIYLDKSRTGEWRMKLAEIESEAGLLRQKALASAKDMSFSEHQRAAFARNAEVNEVTLKAVSAYVKILDQHEAVIQAKAAEAAKMLLLAENSYRTVSVTDQFLTLIKSNQDSFEALLQLELPPLEVVNDSFQAEFAALTHRITNDVK